VMALPHDLPLAYWVPLGSAMAEHFEVVAK
jgi:hypothetical protein